MIADLIRRNRTCRRFEQGHRISMDTLAGLVDLARLSASAANLQPLRYLLSNDPETNEKIFACLKWAAYLKEWDGPAPGERPAAYIVVMNDTRISKKVDCDHGIAGWSILLGAREQGLAGCMLAAINHPRLRNALDIEAPYQVLLVLAMGKPAEKIIVEPVGEDGDIRYWRDDNQGHHVPKRRLEDIIVNRFAEGTSDSKES